MSKLGRIRTILLVPGISIFLGGLSLSGSATTLPESYPLSQAGSAPNPVDPALVAWWEAHVERPPAFSLDQNAFKKLLASQDVLTRSWLALAKANQSGPAAQARQQAAALLTLLTDSKTSETDRAAHPLLPLAYQEILQTSGLSEEELEKARAGLRTYGKGSCSEKQYLMEQLNPANLAQLSDDNLRELLVRLDGFRSKLFKRNALRRLITTLPENRQTSVADQVFTMAQVNPAIIEQTPWLRKLADKSAGKSTDVQKSSFAQARAHAGKRLCSQAKDAFMRGLSQSKAPNSLHDALTVAKVIGDCYRSRGAEMRRDFWQKIETPIEQVYGFRGWAEARHRVGYLYWSADDFDNAKKIFNELVKKGAEKKDAETEAKAVHALARIAENQTDYDLAIKYYEDYTKRFQNQENFEEALMSVVLLLADRSEWQKASELLGSLIEVQTRLPTEKRSVSSLSFAYFWAGRVYLEQGRREEATEMWRRGASEYYSTYYGAISHYMLEHILGRKLALEPSRTPSFRLESLIEPFAPEDRQRVKRIESLTRLGLRSEATCELDELDMADGKPEKVLFKAMLLHASGEWLNAVKAYDSLPRSFRHSLAVGFERILFPRNYSETIREYASKLDVDPDFVMAIIRQESVFNPQARSPVGASGLMQLMPHTAKVEVARFKEDYMPQAKRKSMQQKAQDPDNLLESELNLAIGIHHVKTLMSRYPGPVFVLSAYNANPSAAQRWMKNIPTKDVLSFIEKIPYRETRAYVKLVLRNYFYYKRWYNEPTNNLKHLDSVTSPLVAIAKEPATKAGENKGVVNH